MIIRLGHTLAKKTGATGLPTRPAHVNPLADWSAHLFTTRRVQYILVSNTASLYSMVLFGTGITESGRLIERVTWVIREVMEHDGLGRAYEEYVVPETGQFVFAKALNRSVTGSMNDLVFQAKVCLDADVSPYDVSFLLNELPMSYLKYRKPLEAVRLLVSDIPLISQGLDSVTM
jgi:hypothetical protein